MKMSSVVAAAIASAFFGVTSVQAAPVLYSDFASWSAAVSTNLGTVTIPAPSSPDGYDYFGTGTVTFGGVTFSTNVDLFNIGPGYSGGNPPVLLSQQQLLSQGANLLITFAQLTTAFSLKYGSFDGNEPPLAASDVTFLLSNGATFSLGGEIGFDYTTPGFVGVTDTPFSWVLITTPDAALLVNDLVYGIPEPSTWVMLILGFLGMAAFAARRRSFGGEALRRV